MTRHYQDFASFWPFYVSQHMKPATRVLHWVGSTLGLVALALLFALYSLFPWNLIMIPAGLVVGYAFAWAAHFFIEKNRPATFLYPWWSFVGDWKMWGLMTVGRMKPHVEAVQQRLDTGWQSRPDRLAAPETEGTAPAGTA